MIPTPQTDRTAGHTPGPWTYRRAKTPTDGEYDFAVAATIEGEPCVIAECFGRASQNIRPNAEANARLIVAAPDMRAALQDIMIGGNHLADVLIRLIGLDFAEKCPVDTDPEIALRILNATIKYDIWCCWAAIMRARSALAAASEPQP